MTERRGKLINPIGDVLCHASNFFPSFRQVPVFVISSLHFTMLTLLLLLPTLIQKSSFQYNSKWKHGKKLQTNSVINLCGEKKINIKFCK
jgi:hypothetical protein